MNSGEKYVCFRLVLRNYRGGQRTKIIVNNARVLAIQPKVLIVNSRNFTSQMKRLFICSKLAISLVVEKCVLWQNDSTRGQKSGNGNFVKMQ